MSDLGTWPGVDADGSPVASWRWLTLFVGAVAGALLVPFLIAAPAVDRWFAEFETTAAATGLTALVVIGLLTIDVVAPIPSSLVAALAGAAFGPFLGAAIVFVGLSLGCTVGYLVGGAARTRIGAGRSSRRAFAAASAIHSRDGAVAVIVTRPVPLLAEATVVVAGLSGMHRTTFAISCLVANAGVAILFAAVPAMIA